MLFIWGSEDVLQAKDKNLISNNEGQLCASMGTVRSQFMNNHMCQPEPDTDTDIQKPKRRRLSIELAPKKTALKQASPMPSQDLLLSLQCLNEISIGSLSCVWSPNPVEHPSSANKAEPFQNCKNDWSPKINGVNNNRYEMRPWGLASASTLCRCLH